MTAIASILGFLNRRNGLCIVSLVLLLCVTAVGGEYRSTVGYNDYNLLDEGNSYTSDFSESFITTQFSGQSKSFNWNVSIVYHQPQGGIEWGSVPSKLGAEIPGHEFSGSVHFMDKSLGGLVGISNKSNSLGLGLEWKDRFHNGNDFAASILWRPFPLISGQLKIGTSDNLPSSSNIYYRYAAEDGYEYEGGKIDWVAPSFSSELRFEFAPIRRVDLSYRFKDIKFDPDEPDQIQSASGTYEGHLDGHARDGEFRVSYSLSQDSRLNYKYRKISLDSRLRGYYRDQSFAHFGLVRGNLEYRTLSFTRRDMEFAVSAGEMQGELKGSVEAWPFLDGLLRFIGERRHFVSEWEANWKNLTWADQILRLRRHRLFGTVEFYRIKPKASYATWRPVLFGFGIDDLKSDRLEIKSAELMRLELRTRIDLRFALLDVHASQWLPIRLKKYDQPKNDSTPSEPTPSTASSKTTGGFDFGLYLVRDFGIGSH